MRRNYNNPKCLYFILLNICIKSSFSFYCPKPLLSPKLSSPSISTSTSLHYIKSERIPEISNWKVLPTGSVIGIVEKHSVIEDGDVITTSTLIDPTSCGEGKIVTTTTGSKYKLKMRLIDNINEDLEFDENDALQQQVDLNGESSVSSSSLRINNVNGVAVEKNGYSNNNNGKQQQEISCPEITNWEILSNGEVLGTVQNHPTYEDGDIITTSSIQQDSSSWIEGSVVSTKSGSKYKLLKPKLKPQPSLNVEKNDDSKTNNSSSPGSFFEKFLQQESKRLQDSVSTLLPTINIKNQAPTSSATKEMSYNGKSVSRRSSSNAILPEISNWKVLPTGAIVGIVNNHPIIDDGDIITTSPLLEPNNCQEDMIVSTKTGSQYKLKNAFLLFNTVNSVLQQSRKSKSTPTKQPQQQQQINTQQSSSSSSSTKNLSQPTEYEGLVLTEQTVGEGKYMLVNYPRRSTSGKSLIYTAFRADKEGLPTGKRVVVKLTPNENALQREYYNYKHVTTSGFLRGKFAQCIDFYPIADTKHFTTQSALVIEGGLKDLKQLLNSRWGQGLTGQAMRDVAFAAGQCIQAMHTSNMVWTDLKTENFVIMEEEDGNSGLKSVKGIDLESARPIGQNPVDYSPEACPPEFAKAFVNGYGAEFILEPTYDMWSLGMMLYELSTGTPYFENKSPVTITKILPSEGFTIDVSKVENEKLRDLIEQLLNIDPNKRPDINQYFMHPFFTTTGIGGFSFIR